MFVFSFILFFGGIILKAPAEASASEDEQLNMPDVPTSKFLREQLRNLHRGHDLRSLTAVSSDCIPEDVVLSDFQQWRDETGYWIGDYSLYESSGEPLESSQWPFPYDNYHGFITGNVEGNAYRQRNVFVYPPLPIEGCEDYNSNLTNMFDGTCGRNGNTKLFFADQKVTNCTNPPDGSIEGPFAGIFTTKTNLIGDNNAVLYQVYLDKDSLGPGFPSSDCLFQSQLTTITRSSDGGQVYRTRSAQGFECFDPATYGQPTSVSYYRERKVDEEEFISTMEATLAEFNVTVGDTCAWENDAANNAVPSAYYNNPGIEACLVHLNESFELEMDNDTNTNENMDAAESQLEGTDPTSEQSAAALPGTTSSWLRGGQTG